MLDSKAFRSISYGLYLISSQSNGAVSGCTVNTFAQVTSKPFQVSVAMNKENRTTELIQESGIYTAVSLSEKATLDLIGKFGFFCSRDINKFESYLVAHDERGVPYVNEQVVARFSVRVTNEIDLGTHVMFIGTVEEAEVHSSEKPMTYALYHEVKGGKTPSRASSYIPGLDDDPSEQKGASLDKDIANPEQNDASQEESTDTTAKISNPKYAWRCTVCGHIEEVDELPDDFTCPVCGRGKEMFERIEL